MTDHTLVAMTLRTMAVAVLSLGVGAVFRNARPSARSLVWNVALLGCLVTPLLSSVAPSVVVAVPETILSATNTLVAKQFTATNSTAINSEARNNSDSLSPNLDVGGTAQVLLYFWLAGVLFFTVRFGRQILCARRLARRATVIVGPRVERLVAGAAASLKIRRDAAVLESSEIDIPLATGIIHPKILLPVSARDWTDDELRIVLLHELAHVRRSDIVVRALAMVACTIHWFNPPVWILSSLSTGDAERAADELVLNAGVRPSTYAETLLNLASSVLHFPTAQPAMPLARTTALAGRVHAILRESGRRREISRLTRMTTIGSGCSVAVLAACVTFVPTSPANLLPDARLATVPVALPAPTDSSWIDDATNGLIRALDDASPQVRGGAAHSLGSLGAQRARPALLARSNDPDKYVRYEVDQALAALDRR